MSNFINMHYLLISICFVVLQILILFFNIFIALTSLRISNKEKKARFWLDLHTRFMSFIDLYATLRPRELEDKKEKKYKEVNLSPTDKFRLLEYLGLFEFCEILIENKLMDTNFFMRSYKYQFEDIMKNPYVKHIVFKYKETWSDLIKLCKRLSLMDYQELFKDNS